MTGQVLDYSIQTNQGFISGDDSQRYTFAGSDWPGASAPERGTRVDFDIQDGNRAVSIYLVDAPAVPTAPPAVPTAPPAVPQSTPTPQQTAPQVATGGKVRTTAAILALVGFGVHKFYLGETGGGILRIVLLCTIIGAPITGILCLIDAIKLFQMTDADFDRQYNGGI